MEMRAPEKGLFQFQAKLSERDTPLRSESLLQFATEGNVIPFYKYYGLRSHPRDLTLLEYR